MDWLTAYLIGYVVALILAMSDDKTKEKYPMGTNLFSYFVISFGSWVIVVIWIVETYKCECKDK